jgi:hypothetical protein
MWYCVETLNPTPSRFSREIVIKLVLRKVNDARKTMQASARFNQQMAREEECKIQSIGNEL